MKRNFSEQELVRREKLTALREKGVDPFGNSYKQINHSKELFNKYDKYDKEQLETMNETVQIAGRIMTKREMGKAGFMHIQDKEGQIQIYLRQDVLSEQEFELFTLADIGDIVGIKGKIFRTITGSCQSKRKVIPI